MPVLVIVTVCAAGCVYGVCKLPNDVNGDAFIPYESVTVKLALTVALAPLFPLMLIVSSRFPTASPALGRTVNVAVDPVEARVVVESAPIS